VPADLSRGGEAAAPAPPGRGRGGWVASSPRAVPEEPALLFLPALGASPHLTPPQTWMHRAAGSCPPLRSVSWCGSPFGQVPPGEKQSHSAPEHPAWLLPAGKLPGAALRTSPQLAGDERGSASPESPRAALTPSLNVRLDGSAWTGEVCTLSSCSVLGVAFSSSSPEEAELVQSVVWLRLHRGVVTLPWTCLPQRHRAGLF